MTPNFTIFLCTAVVVSCITTIFMINQKIKAQETACTQAGGYPATVNDKFVCLDKIIIKR